MAALGALPGASASSGAAAELRSIFYSEFDNLKGPQLAFQAPDGFLSDDVFDGVSDYIITKPQLCGKMVSITTGQHLIMGYPLRVESERYHRSTLMFNVGMVFPAGTDTTRFEGVLRKLGNSFHTLETESSLLQDPEKKARLGHMLHLILCGLQDYGEITLPIDSAHTLFLRMVETRPPPKPVRDHDVPVFIRPVHASTIKRWDLTLQLLVPHIDGIQYVKRLAEVTGVAIELVRHAVQQLLHFGLVDTIDIFQYSNIYCTTPRIAALASDPRLRQQCVSYTTRQRKAPPTPSRLFALYAAFQAGQSVRDVCLNHRLKQSHVDDRRFVAFGVLHGIIRRVHEYPVPLVPLSELLRTRVARPMRSARAQRSPVRVPKMRSKATGTPAAPAAVGTLDSSMPGGAAAAAAAGSGADGDAGVPPTANHATVAVGGGGGAAAAGFGGGGGAGGGGPGAGETAVGSRTDAGGAITSGLGDRAVGMPASEPLAAGGMGDARDMAAAASRSPSAVVLSTTPVPVASKPPSTTRLLRLCDGTRSVEEICCTLLRSRAEVLQELDASRHFVVVRK